MFGVAFGRVECIPLYGLFDTHSGVYGLVSATSVRAFFEKKVLMSFCFGTVATAVFCTFVDFLGANGLVGGLLIELVSAFSVKR